MSQEDVSSVREKLSEVLASHGAYVRSQERARCAQLCRMVYLSQVKLGSAPSSVKTALVCEKVILEAGA